MTASNKRCSIHHLFALSSPGIYGSWQPVALVDFCAISNAKIPIIRPAGSLQGKKAPCSRFFGILCAKRNKLLVVLRFRRYSVKLRAPRGYTS
jgi:hypothetical protein